MPFHPNPVQPDFASLYTSLANSKTQKENNALYQTIFLLIRSVTQSRDLLVDDVNGINTTISQILQATILTANDESHLFFNSRQTLAGTGIAFDDTVPHKRTISASASVPSTIAANSLVDAFTTNHDVFENEVFCTLVNNTFSGIGAVNSWTPVLKFGGGTTGITYTTQAAKYLRLGPLVLVWAHILLSSKGSSTGVATITGLPFTINNEAGMFFGPFFANMNSMKALFGLGATAGTSIALNHEDPTGSTNCDDTHFNNTTELYLGGFYTTNDA